MTATITAVHGQVPADQLGITLVHEHLIADISALATTAAHPDRQWMAEVPVSAIDPQTLGRDPLVCADNCRLDDEDGAVAELEHYARAGGATLVECTTAGLAPDIGKLARVAARSSVNIIAPTGYYLWFTCQQEVEGRSEHELAETMLRDITEGIPASPATASYPAIRAGVIGELGTSAELHPREETVLRAAALAHSQTGTPIAVHLDQAGHEAHRIIGILTSGGVDPQRIVIGHLDQRRVYEPDYLIAIARSGVMLGFDTFGTTYAYDSAGIDDPTDSQRIELLARIVQAGFIDQCVLSHDVGCKSMLRRHGGGGYSHLLTDLRPSMLMRGLTEEALEQMFIRNPARWLAGDDPGSL